MFITARPHTKLAAILLTAAMVATAPVVVGAGPETLPALRNIDVRNASFVTDALHGLGDVVSATADVLMIGTDFALGLNYYWDDGDFGWGVPINPVFLASAFVENPGSALSYLLQTYLNPSDNYVNPNDNTEYYYAYPWYVKSSIIQPLVELLPAPLADSIMAAINGFANGINTAFLALPDPTAAINHMWEQYNTPIGRMIYAVQDAIALPVTLGAAIAYSLAYAPATLEATVESAIQKPADIPGLLSFLVYGALDPTLYGGLLGNLSYNLLKPLFFLPAPIGESGFGLQDGLAYSIYQGFASVVSGLLSNLPTPITPTPFPSPAAAAPAAAKSGDAAAPETSSTELPNVRGQGQSARKAVRPAGDGKQQSTAKSTAKKAKSESTGGEGRSARGNQAA
jgi:hypothetical protein